MTDDRMRRFFRRLKGENRNNALQSVATIRSKPRINVGWNDFKYHLRNLSRTELTDASLKAFFAPMISLNVESQLFGRWVQTLAILPLFREAMISPFRTNLYVEQAIKLHQSLRPYLASVVAASREYKWSILQSLDKFEPENTKMQSVTDSFMIGSALLVAPILGESIVQRYVYLPTGQWFYFASSKRFDGNQYVTVDAPLDQLPLFIKAGTVFPLQFADPLENTLVYRVFPGEAETVLYEDGSLDFNGEHGEYRWIYITCGWDENKLIINRRVAGQYQPSYAKIRIEVVDLPAEPSAVNIDRRPAPLWYFDRGLLEFTTESFHRIEVLF